MKTLKHTTIFLSMIFIAACNNENKKQNEPTVTEEKKDTIISANNPMDTIPVQEVPYKDTVNVGEIEKFPKYSNEIIEQLSLKKVAAKYSNTWYEECRFKIVYKLNLSPNFYSLVVEFMPNNNESYHYLVNYDVKMNFIDICLLSGDDVVEGFSYSWSLITQSEILRYDANGMEEQDDQKTKFKIYNDGRIEMSEVDLYLPN
jgi:hypothetical protein